MVGGRQTDHSPRSPTTDASVSHVDHAKTLDWGSRHTCNSPPSVPRQPRADSWRDCRARMRPRRAAGRGKPHAAAVARFPQRVCALRRHGCRPDDARGAGVRARAQRDQAGGRAAAGAAVRAVPLQAGRGAHGHDDRARRSRAHRRQRADSDERGALVQRADGRGPVVRQPDRGRLLPRAAASGHRPRKPHCEGHDQRESLESGCAAHPRSACAGSDVAACPDDRGLSRGAAQRIAPGSRAGCRRGRAVVAGGIPPCRRRSPGGSGVVRLAGHAIDRDARRHRRSASCGGGGALRRWPPDRRHCRHRLPDGRIGRALASNDAGVRELQPDARPASGRSRASTSRSS